MVADEVRNLAQRSATAAKETADKISDSVAKSLAGVSISRDVTQTFNDIKEKVARIETLISEIAIASREQSQGIGQIDTALSEIDKVTQTTAATAAESAEFAQTLRQHWQDRGLHRESARDVVRRAKEDLSGLAVRCCFRLTGLPAGSHQGSSQVPSSFHSRSNQFYLPSQAHRKA